MSSHCPSTKVVKTLFNTTLCLINHYYGKDASSVQSSMSLYASESFYSVASCNIAKNTFLDFLKSIDVKMSGVVLSSQKSKRASIVADIVKMLMLLKSKHIGQVRFYPNYDDLDKIIDGSPQALKLKRVGEIIDEQRKKIDASLQTVGKISYGVSTILNKVCDITTQSDITKKVVKESNSLSNSTNLEPMVISSVPETEKKTVESKDYTVDLVINQNVSNVDSKGQDNSLEDVKLVQEKRKRPFFGPKTYSQSVRDGKTFKSKTKQELKSWSPCEVKALKLRISNNMGVDNINNWCQKSEKLKNLKFSFSSVNETARDRTIQIICKNWPSSSEIKFEDKCLWPIGCDIRKWNGKPLKYRKPLFLKKFIGGCSLATTEDGLKNKIKEIYGEEKIDVLVVKVSKDNSLKGSSFFAKIGVTDGQKTSPSEKLDDYFKSDTWVYSRNWKGSLPVSVNKSRVKNNGERPTFC